MTNQADPPSAWPRVTIVGVPPSPFELAMLDAWIASLPDPKPARVAPGEFDKLEPLLAAYHFKLAHRGEDTGAGTRVAVADTATYDCLALCGPMGDFRPDIPTIALQPAGPSWRTLNFGALADRMPHLYTIPTSGTDWYFRGSFERRRDYEAWARGRAAMADQRRKRAAAPAA